MAVTEQPPSGAPGSPERPPGPAPLAERLAAHPSWYHAIDLPIGPRGPGRWTTPGWFDLRHVLDRLPWPDVAGARALDVGTFDGSLAFELERRGATDVVAIDIPDHRLWDWPADTHPDRPGSTIDDAFRGPPKGAGFALAKEALGSGATWRARSIYDLDPEVDGRFDVVVVGSLLLHLRDPVRALEAVRRVLAPGGVLISSDQIEVLTTLLHRRRPVFQLRGTGESCTWWLANASGHRQLLHSAGFTVEAATRPYVVRFHEHPAPGHDLRNLVRTNAIRAIGRDVHPGVLHRALRARDRL